MLEREIHTFGRKWLRLFLCQFWCTTVLLQKQIASWGTLFKLVTDAVSNPYVFATIGVSAYNVYADNATPGFGDSVRALSYKKPKA